MKRSVTEYIAASILGVIAYLLYVPYMGIIFTFTIKVFDIMRLVPCDSTPCTFRQFVYFTTIIVHDTIVGIPIILLFGILLGVIVSIFRVSRPLLLSAAFFLTQFYYLFIHTEIGFPLPIFVEVLRAIPVIILFVLFTKIGSLIKSRKLDEK